MYQIVQLFLFLRYWRLKLVSISANRRHQFLPRSLNSNIYLRVFNSFWILLYTKGESLHNVKCGNNYTGWDGRSWRGNGQAYVWSGRSKEKRPLGNLNHISSVILKWISKDTLCYGGMESTEPVKDKWRSVANDVNGVSCPVNSRKILGQIKGNQPLEGLCTKESLTPQNTTKNSPQTCTYNTNPPVQHRYSSDWRNTYIPLEVAEKKRRTGPHIWPASTLASIVAWCRSLTGHNTRENKRLSPHETDSPCPCFYCIIPPWQDNDQWRADTWYCAWELIR
jgi:hypothetical protein